MIELTITSSAWVDIADAELSILSYEDLAITGVFRGWTGAGARGHARVLLDGEIASEPVSFAGGESTVSIVWLYENPGFGRHSIKLQWCVTGGQAYLWEDSVGLLAQEVA